MVGPLARDAVPIVDNPDCGDAAKVVLDQFDLDRASIGVERIPDELRDPLQRITDPRIFLQKILSGL
ncbi:hypothetical protein NEE01_22795 [Sphingomonas sp. MMSM24]|uniref:Uncharacterized protein n=1 Tax=Sphingomonas lycopersici TaxID=2951807 RepID=A0AA41ZKL6_9SPHN|nr:hypothetical protein [Sphingomonas lycopersici]